MSGRINLLAGVLAAQLLLISAFLAADLFGSGEGAAAFVEFASDEVDGVLVAGAEGEAVELARIEGAWSVAGLPADAEKITKVLDKLANVTAAWPVATSEDARERFEVTAEKHQRRIELRAGGERVAEVFLGTSPGYRRVHARAGDSDDVYSIDLATYEVPVGVSEWLDKTLLEADGEVAAVRREGEWSLEKGEEGWLVTPAGAAPSAADQDAALQLADRFESLRVLDVAGGEGEGTFEERSRFVVTDAGGEHELVLLHDAEADEYVVTSSRVAGRFELAGYVAEQLLVAPDDLQVAAGAAEDDAADGPAESPP